MGQMNSIEPGKVHCRVGSLKIGAEPERLSRKVHCRVGSLKNLLLFLDKSEGVHCRVGSLETCRYVAAQLKIH